MSAADLKVIERIRKLLALATSANANEAASALAHAQRLMEEHRLDQAAVDAAAIEAHDVSEGIARARRVPNYEIHLIAVVNRAFGVRALRQSAGGDRVTFYGPGHKAEVAAYCFKVLLRQLCQARREFMDKAFSYGDSRGLVSRADHFANGWVEAVEAVITEVFMTEREEAAVALFVRDTFGKLTTRAGCRPRGMAGADDAHARGLAAGQRVQLHRAMNGGRSVGALR